MPRPQQQQRMRLFGSVAALCALAYLASSFYYHKFGSSASYAGPYKALESGSEHGFMPLNEAQGLCRTHNLDLYKTRDRHRKVYDLFLFNTELDWLEVRLNELYNEVDYFLILESSTTFQSTPKPLHLLDNWSRFHSAHPKMIRQTVNLTNTSFPTGDTWERERFTRNALFTQALASLSEPRQAPAQGDVLLVSDIDEIPRPSTIGLLRNCAFPSRVTLTSHFYYYSFQWRHRGQQWPHPQATFYNGASATVAPEDLRTGKAAVELGDAAWHCSSCLPTLSDLMNKISSFSHKVYNHPYILDRAKLLQNIRQGEDIFERKGEAFDRVEQNKDIPGFLLGEEGRRKFDYMLDRDPENGNFRDSDGVE